MSELEVNIDSELSKIEETYSFMENLNDNNEVSRPESNVSFSSWTFSPITDETCEGQVTQEESIMRPEKPTEVSQKLPPLQQMNHQSCQVMNNPDYSKLHNHQQQKFYPNNHYQPNTVYHHSVNIHNYNVGMPAWSYEGPTAYSVYNINMPQTEYIVDKQDPLAAFNDPETEYARCSTPEYLMALNSLNQPDSPPVLQSTAKILQDCSYAPSVSDHSASGPKHIELKKQDSGYNSDLDASPVIGYQDNHMKTAHDSHMRKKHLNSSTPAAYPVLQIANMLNKESGNLVPRRLLSPPLMSMPGFVPKMYAGNPSNYLASSEIQSQAGNQLSMRKVQSEKISSSLFHRHNSVRFTSMADFQAAKKRAAQEKRKAEEVTSNKENANSKPQKQLLAGLNETSNPPIKRRRHNEPLNYVALQVMNKWYEEHLNNPYPTKAEKENLAEEGGISVSQVKSWFANKRNRSNNTRPKKQRKVMEEQLMNICHQLAQDARKPNKDNAYYIQQLSSIMDSTKQQDVSP